MKRKRIHPLFIHVFIVLAILFIAALPLISVAIASEIANANGCQLDEGSVHPCIVNGVDQGELLYTMGMMGWFMLATIPLGLGAAALYILIVVGFYIVRGVLRARAADAPAAANADRTNQA